MNMIAAISGENLVNAIVWIVIAAVVFWLLNYLIDYVKIAEPFNKVAKVILMVAAIVILINALLSIMDKGFIKWP